MSGIANTSTSPTTTSKRRWYQWSLRALLVAVFALSIPLGMIAWERERCARGHALIAAIEDCGGHAGYRAVAKRRLYFSIVHEKDIPRRAPWLEWLCGDNSFEAHTAVEMDYAYEFNEGLMNSSQRRNRSDYSILFTKKPTLDELLPQLRRLPNLQVVVLHQIGNEELRHLQRLNQLRCVDLDDAPITDDGLVHLTGLPHLEILKLNGTKITDDGLAKLKGISQLRDLQLVDTQITTKSLNHLAEMTQLEALSLSDIKMTDGAVDDLERLANLKSLRIRTSKIPDAEDAYLSNLLPYRENIAIELSVTTAH
jgi:hypothetical protein